MSLARKLLLMGITLGALTSCASKPANANWTLQVEGPPGTQFTGQCTTQVTGFFQDDKAVGLEIQDMIANDGQPREYQASGNIIACNFRNLVADGSLVVRLLKNGTLVKEVQEETPEGDLGIGFGPN